MGPSTKWGHIGSVGSVRTLWGAGRERVWGLCWDGAGAGGIGCGYGYGYGYGYGVGYLCPSVQGIY